MCHTEKPWGMNTGVQGLYRFFHPIVRGRNALCLHYRRGHQNVQTFSEMTYLSLEMSVVSILEMFSLCPTLALSV